MMHSGAGYLEVSCIRRPTLSQSSIASTIANEFPEAGPGSLKLNALLELGFLLFVISFLVLALARWLVRSRLQS